MLQRHTRTGRTIRIRASLVFAAVSISAAAACSNVTPPNHQPPLTPVRSSSPEPARQSSSTGPRKLSVSIVKRIRLSTGTASNVFLDGVHAVVSVSSSVTRQTPDSVLLIDVLTGKQSVVAHSAWPQGLIGWQVIQGDWVAWVDQSRVQDDGDWAVLWRVWAENIVTKNKRLLASSGSRPAEFVPEVEAGQNWFVWGQQTPRGDYLERAWNPDLARPETLAQHADVVQGSETITNGSLVYLGSSALPHHGETVGGDCWRISLSGVHEAPQALTHTGLAMGCAADGTDLIWDQHFDYVARHLPDRDDDPQSFWYQSLSTGTPTPMRARYSETRYPVIGDGFATWSTQDCAYLVHALAKTGETCLGASSVADAALGSSAAGKLFAFGLIRGERSPARYLEIARVST